MSCTNSLHASGAYNSQYAIISEQANKGHPEKFRSAITRDQTKCSIAPWNVGDFSNVYIPSKLSEEQIYYQCDPDNEANCKSHQAAKTRWVNAAAVVGTAGAGIGAGVAAGAAFGGPIGAAVGLTFGGLVVGIQAIINATICGNSYVLAPHEVYNFAHGYTYEASRDKNSNVKKDKDGNIQFHWAKGGKNMESEAATIEDVPFYYTCKDPGSESGKFLGYRGGDEDYCSVDKAKFAVENWKGGAGITIPSELNPKEIKNKRNKNRKDSLIGTIEVRMLIPGRDKKTGGDPFYENKKSTNAKGVNLVPGSSKNIHLAFKAYSFYRVSKENSTVEICAANPYTTPPMMIGCTSTSPPYEERQEFFGNNYSNTRCLYFSGGRKDLKALGAKIEQDETIPAQDNIGKVVPPIARFLKSDLHITSTIVGCVKDILAKVFLNADVSEKSNVTTNRTGMLGYIQDKLRTVVLAALTLYLTVIGIQLMSSAQVPDRGKIIMYAVKFALVIYFTTPAAWYQKHEGKITGIYPTIIESSDIISGWFLQTLVKNDPMGYCSNTSILGKELLQDQEIPASGECNGVVPKPGQLLPTCNAFSDNVIKLSVWDLVDCKLANYFNLGSCNYGLVGMFVFWFISTSLLAGVTGFLLSIILLIYVVLMMKVIFKFAHITILSLFVLTILVTISPLIIVFSLFEPTKGIFDEWCKMLLGYILYPALLLAFVAFMLSTLDAVYYGDLQLNEAAFKTEGWKSRNTDNPQDNPLAIACDGVDSVFCTSVRQYGGNPCNRSAVSWANENVKTTNFVLFKAHTLSSTSTKAYFIGMVKMMLFAFLFYFFIESVSSFLAFLVSVSDLGGAASGGVSARTMIKGAAKATGASAAIKAGKALNDARKKSKQGGEGGGDSKSGGSGGDSSSGGDSGGDKGGSS